MASERSIRLAMEKWSIYGAFLTLLDGKSACDGSVPLGIYHSVQVFAFNDIKRRLSLSLSWLFNGYWFLELQSRSNDADMLVKRRKR